MSKQEKLAALIGCIRNNYHDERTLMAVVNEYEKTPDDPPQPPEMPECVKELIECCDLGSLSPSRWKAIRKDIHDHYAQPLKLEVGKVYEDASGRQVRIVHCNPEADLVFCWLGYCGPLFCWYADDGRPAFVNRPNLIRRIL